MKTEITELLGIEYPIIQGGMAWVAEHHLAAAVSEAGGLGLIGAASAPADWVREQIRKAKELTQKPFGVNIMLMSPYADDVAKVIVEAVSRYLNVPLEKFPMNMQEYGNTSSASIPILLDEMNRNQRLKKGQKIVLAGFGAGLTWGASVLEW